MTKSLTTELHERFPDLTKAEKAVASYVLTHMKGVPFETAASIAENVGVSPMTVSRFLRTLGFNGLSELKDRLKSELGAAPLLISDRVNRIRKGSSGDAKLWDNFDLEVQSTLNVYELRDTPGWKRAVDILAGSSDVFVAGYQTISGIASDFSARLDYIRPNTSFLDERNGTFSELLAARRKSPCLTLFEMRRYTSLSHQLSRAAVDAGIALIIICDNHCYWAHDYTENVLPVSTDSHLFWDSQVPFLSLTNLLLDDIVARLGKKVADRIQIMRELQDRFGAFRD
jgi:DNA-binding MurR/RpiR family transcriptional regulator